MKFYSFVNTIGNIRVGVSVDGKLITALDDIKEMKDLIIQYGLDRSSIMSLIENSQEVYNIEDVVLKAPLLNPGKMIFVGLNYREHAKESNLPIPQSPILFAKFANSIVGKNENIVITRETKQCDYEAELAVIIGKRGKNISEASAMEFVFGYTICNDISARDLQANDDSGQWLRGKAIDTFAPIGPCIVTIDEISDPHKLSIICKVNEEIRQDSNTCELIFNIPFLLSFISRTITLEPGDFISTGTPSGVADGMNNPAWLKHGDICEVAIQGIGLLRNKVVAD